MSTLPAPENAPIGAGTTTPLILSLEWQVWPVCQNALKLKALLVLMLAGLVWLVLLVSLPPLTSIALGLALALSLLPYYLPSRYQVDATGITIRRGLAQRQRVWSEFRSYKIYSGGYLLNAYNLPDHVLPLRARLTSRWLFLPQPADASASTLLASLLSLHLTKPVSI